MVHPEIGGQRNGGYCSRCARWHELLQEPARRACLELMAKLEAQGRVDFDRASVPADPRFATAPLFRPGCGKMLGVLLGRDRAGNIRQLRAFSGMLGGLWQVPGWAPPLFDEAAFRRLHEPAAVAIKVLTEQMAALPASSPLRLALRRERRRLSRENTAALQQLCRLENCRGERRPPAAFFPANGGPPTGTGDCCAPKLLHAAREQGLVPFAMAEFFWGSSAPGRPRSHGQFYLPCVEKCQPILGFLLCGLEAKG